MHTKRRIGGRLGRLLAVSLAAVLAIGAAGGVAGADPAQALVNGAPVAKGEFPFYTWLPQCGAALVAPEWVVTAEHCTWPEMVGTQLAVATYNVDDKSPELYSTIREVVRPRIPGLTRETPDVALLRIDPVAGKPIPLAGPLDEGAIVRSVGMGSTRALTTGQFRVVSHRTSDSTTGVLTVNGTTQNIGGDSGSPFLVETTSGPRLAGVHSYRLFSGSTTWSNFVDVASTPELRDWFRTVTKTKVAPLDATVSLRSVSTGYFASAREDRPGKDVIVGNHQTFVGGWERFDLIRNSDYTVSVRAQMNGKFLCAPPDGALVAANRDWSDTWEKFSPVENGDGTVSLRAASNGKYLRVQADATGLAANGDTVSAETKFVIQGL